MSILRYILSA